MTDRNGAGFPENKFWNKTILILVCITFLLPLAAYTWGGTSMRYSGDDYCYGQALVENGMFGNQVSSYLNPMPYNGNRYSLTLFSNIGDLFGAISSAVMPGLAILLWVAGSWLLLNELGKLLKLKPGSLIKLMLAGFMVFITLYQAPFLMQDLYWRTAMLTYLAPVICLSWLIWLVLVYMNSDRKRPELLPVISLYAFISAGFSETGAALQAASLGICLLGLLVLHLKIPADYKKGLTGFGAALAGILVGMLILAVSPSNVDRIGDYPHPDLIHLVTLSITHAYTFIIESLRSYPLPSLVTLAFSTAIAWIASKCIKPGKTKLRDGLLTAGLIVLVCFTLVAATAAPSVLARTTYPEQRAWMPGRAAMTAGLVALGLLVGVFFHQFGKLGYKLSRIIILSVFLATSLYILRTLPRILAEIQPYRTWATAWDARERIMRVAIDRGEMDLRVNELPMIIPYVSELKPNPNNWYNACAAGWYGVDTITAVETP